MDVGQEGILERILLYRRWRLPSHHQSGARGVRARSAPRHMNGLAPPRDHPVPADVTPSPPADERPVLPTRKPDGAWGLALSCAVQAPVHVRRDRNFYGHAGNGAGRRLR